MSLWPVAYREAVPYMVTFYWRLQEDKPRAKALRLARKAIKARHPQPFF